MYKLIENSDSILRLSDNAIIPPSPGNRAWDEYLDWLDKGNVPLSADSELDFYPETIEEAKRYMQQLIVDTAAAKQEALVQGYSAAERDTWDFKERLCIKVRETGDLESAKYLKAEAQAMVGTKDEETINHATEQLISKIIIKADKLRLASAIISGTRARKWNEVKNLTDIKEIMNYPVNEGWD